MAPYVYDVSREGDSDSVDTVCTHSVGVVTLRPLSFRPRSFCPLLRVFTDLIDDVTKSDFK
jgi:hypothetical protein